MKVNTHSTWTVKNWYGIRGETNHRTPAAALRAAKKREGDGWIVIDEAGNQWSRNSNGEPEIVIHATA